MEGYRTDPGCPGTHHIADEEMLDSLPGGRHKVGMDTGALALTTRTLVGEGGPTEANTEQGPRCPPSI